MKYATKISNSHIKTKINQLIPHIFQQKIVMNLSHHYYFLKGGAIN